jgi:hypothetical protein
MTEAYPLAWPEGWPRTPWDDRKNGHVAFKRQVDNGRYREGKPWSFAAARDALVEEIWRQGAKTCVVSSNFQSGKNFLPIEGRKRPQEEGVAIYFQRSGKQIVMACDRYHDAEGNMRSLTLALEALRQLERHGGGVMLERAYQGFAALPAPPKSHEILGVAPGASADEVRKAWRAKIGGAHPDNGGTGAAELNAARDDMLKRLGAA